MAFYTATGPDGVIARMGPPGEQMRDVTNDNGKTGERARRIETDTAAAVDFDPAAVGEPQIHTSVSLTKEFGPVTPMKRGLLIVGKPNAKAGSLPSWEDVVWGLGWALERSPKMRAHVREMLARMP